MEGGIAALHSKKLPTPACLVRVLPGSSREDQVALFYSQFVNDLDEDAAVLELCQVIKGTVNFQTVDLGMRQDNQKPGSQQKASVGLPAPACSVKHLGFEHAASGA